jgi:hypothetical protein
MNETTFLNIDLDIESAEDIAPIVQEWGGRICVHRYEEIEGVFYGSFETPFGDVEGILSEYVSLINGLSPEARGIWNRATIRVFDFGYEAGDTPNGFHSKIEADFIKRLAEIGGSIVVTIYPAPRT